MKDLNPKELTKNENRHIKEQKIDLMTMQSWREINDGLSEPIEDLLEMIEEDKKIWNKMNN